MCKRDWKIQTEKPLRKKDGRAIVAKLNGLLAEYKNEAECNRIAFDEWSAWLKNIYTFEGHINTHVRWASPNGATQIDIEYRDSKEIILLATNKQ